MAQSLSKIIIHIIFSTKQRASLISNDIIPELCSYIGGTLRELDSQAIKIGATEDHIHILCLLSKNIAVCSLVAEVKKRSSKWIKTKGAKYSDFQWQNGYCVFSVSQSIVKEVADYVAGQKERHRRMSFQEEFRKFLEKHQIAYDEEHVWG